MSFEDLDEKVKQQRKKDAVEYRNKKKYSSMFMFFASVFEIIETLIVMIVLFVLVAFLMFRVFGATGADIEISIEPPDGVYTKAFLTRLPTSTDAICSSI